MSAETRQSEAALEPMASADVGLDPGDEPDLPARRSRRTVELRPEHAFDAVVIGVSAGGFDALSQVLPALPEDFAPAVIVVQHRGPQSPQLLAETLGRACRLPVREPRDKEPVTGGTIWLAPAGYHLMVEDDGVFGLNIDPRINHSRPSIDALFESAAGCWGPRVVGVVLTGANSDGARGLSTIARFKGLCLVQNPDTAEVPVMPRTALEAVDSAERIELEDLAPRLTALAVQRRPRRAAPKTSALEDIEIDLVLEAVFRAWGYDFRHYGRATLRRRLRHRAALERCGSISELIPRLVREPELFQRFVRDMSTTVTEMFRDAEAFKVLREAVIPILKTWPFVKIWHAGCSTGEEVYSLAILLKEEGFLDRARIYATDFNEDCLATAREGVYPLDRMRGYSRNYLLAGGRASLSEYYHACYNHARLDPALRRNVTFARHNLVSDGSFGEMHLILCRNVLIYFDFELQHRVLSVLRDSLVHRGFLTLGSRESLKHRDLRAGFEDVAPGRSIYRLRETPTPNAGDSSARRIGS